MPQTLFINAHLVLDGFAELQRGFNVLVSDGRIVAVSPKPIEAGGATVIDVGGRTLMPGLIDAHAHITGLSLTPKNIANPAADIAIASANYLRNCLMDGYTTIREAGGADHATARLLAEGQIVGPRLYYSGRALTQTGGGADFRTPDEEIDPCGHVGPFSVMSVITDGTDEVRKAAREELRRGATQIKLFASGGVVFPAEGHATRYEFSEAELRAAVEEAAARGTYVMAHVYTDEGVRRCLGSRRALDRACQLRERGDRGDDGRASRVLRADLHLAGAAGRKRGATSICRRPSSPTSSARSSAASQVYGWARKHKVPIGFGTDLWGPEAQKSQLREFEMRRDSTRPPSIMRSATAVNAELLMEKGMLGRIAEGAYADLLVVEGNPLADLGVLLDPQKNLKLIMKDGTIYKNELAA